MVPRVTIRGHQLHGQELARRVGTRRATTGSSVATDSIPVPPSEIPGYINGVPPEGSETFDTVTEAPIPAPIRQTI